MDREPKKARADDEVVDDDALESWVFSCICGQYVTSECVACPSFVWVVRESGRATRVIAVLEIASFAS
jgi:hypothetical protein